MKDAKVAERKKGESFSLERGEIRRAGRRGIGNLIVVTGPSGVGKGTVVSRLMVQVPELVKSVSVTTRKMRPNEKDGVDYFYRGGEEFGTMIDNGLFLEYAEYAGNLYGTPRAWVEEQLNRNRDVILEIEVQGAKQVMEAFADSILIFLSPPSWDELKNRLRGRSTERPEELVLRLAKARQEMRERNLFHYEVLNDNIDDAVNNLAHIVYAERCRIRKQKGTFSHEHD